jgi:hypothetical protein
MSKIWPGRSARRPGWTSTAEGWSGSAPAAVRAPSQSVRLGNRVIRGPGQASGAPWPSLAPTAAPGNPPEFAVAAPPPGQRPGPGRSTADRESPAARPGEKLAVGGRYRDSELVFTRPDGTAVHPERFSDWFRQRVRAAGLPRIRLHDVRHSYATAALAAGVPAKVVSERLGHANIRHHHGHLQPRAPRPGRAGRRTGCPAHSGCWRPGSGDAS